MGWRLRTVRQVRTTDDTPSLPEPYLSEPDRGTSSAIQGTLTVSELIVGDSYDIFCWDTVEDAFTYTDTFKRTSLKATNGTYVYRDDTSIQSDGTTYYRCVVQGK